MDNKYVERVIDLTDSRKNIIYNMSVEEAREKIKSGNIEDVKQIDGQFALVSVEGKTVRMARSIGRPLRYFIAKLIDGPCLVISDML
jgi:asparagine synthase (glutamine-hydrolysing)